MIVIGNKSDLLDESGVREVLGSVDDKVDVVTSALDNANVEQAFQLLATRILHA